MADEMRVNLIDDDDFESELTRILSHSGMTQSMEFIVRRVRAPRPLNVGITGRPGVGKSSLANLLRDVDPDHNNINIYDLPGVGANQFPKDEYMDVIDADRFDLFILVISARDELDEWLRREIIKRQKSFWIVKTKIDSDVRNDRRDYPTTHNEIFLLKHMRLNVSSRLNETQFKQTPVFLIDNYERQMYDFKELAYSIQRACRRPQNYQIAVVGRQEVGKSSFINAIRSMNAEDPGAAGVGDGNRTAVVTKYPYPGIPDRVELVDTPGAGSDGFPVETYLKDIGAEQFDLIILMVAERFTETDIRMHRELTAMNKELYVARSKIDEDIINNDHGDETEILASMHQDIRDNLQTPQLAPLFLVCNRFPAQYNLNELKNRLLSECSRLKKLASERRLRQWSEKVIKMSVQKLESTQWRSAATSAVAALVPVPGLSLAFDLTIVLSMAKFYFEQLGLDDGSLQRHATLTGNTYESLKDIVSRSLGPDFFSKQRIVQLAWASVSRTSGASLAGEEVVQVGSWFARPLLAAERMAAPLLFATSAVASPLSYYCTKTILNLVLKRLEETALEVVHHAAENATVFDRPVIELENGH